MELPVELQYLICNYLDLEDLRSLRLTSKNLAVIIASALFEEFRFHASNRSVKRLLDIANHERLSKHVKTIIWDSRLYDIGVETCQEWEEWVLEQYNVFDIAKKSSMSTDENETLKVAIRLLRSQYEVYKEDRTEERMLLNGVLGAQNLPNIFARFQHLNEVCIQSSHLTLADRYPIMSESYVSPLEGGKLLNRGDGGYEENLIDGPPGLNAFKTVMHCIRINAHNLTRLRVGRLSWKVFSFQTYDPTWRLGFENTTTLDLAFTLSAKDGGDDQIDECRAEMENGFLRQFLGGMRNLRKLTIDFEQWCECCSYSPARLEDIFPSEHPWPHLQEVGIAFLDTSEEFLVRFINEHSTTLTSVHLEDLQLAPRGSWKSIFTTVIAPLGLKSATVIGDFCSKRGDDVVNVRGELSTALAHYLVHGGLYPLGGENKV